jgi:hypothetical protein
MTAKQGTARPGRGGADNRCDDKNRIPHPFQTVKAAVWLALLWAEEAIDQSFLTNR